MRISLAVPALLVLLAIPGCATIGHDFDSTRLSWLRPGDTGKQEVLRRLGDPFRVGLDSGDQTWTYGFYKYRLVGESTTKDLVIRFAADGKVKSFTLNTSFPEEKTALEPALGAAAK